MHELALVQEMLDVIADAAGGARVRRVVLEIGKLSAVMPDAVRFCFDLAAEQTVAEGALLEIVETPGQARCRPCGAAVVLDGPIGRCACGSIELDWLDGMDLRIREVEVG